MSSEFVWCCSFPNMDCRDSVRFTAYDDDGLPLSSLCQEPKRFKLVLNLKEDEDHTPIKEVAEGTGHNT